MRMPKGKAFISAGLLASALLAGCGGSNNNVIPAVVTIFDAHNAVFRNLTALVTAGNNSFGQLGFDFGNLGDQAVYHPIAGNKVSFQNNSTGHGNVGVAVGAAHTVAFGQPVDFTRPAPFLNSSSVAYAWGSNYHGQIGSGTIPTTGSNAYSRIPVRVGANTADKNGTLLNVPMSGVIAVAAGGFHSLALTKENNGTVYSWGYNGYGELGTNNLQDRIWPGNVLTSENPDTPLTSIIAIAAGADHSLALGSDHTVYAWGDNTYGQVGQDNPTGALMTVGLATKVQTLVELPDHTFTRRALDNITQIAAGATFSIALQDNGGVQNLYFWGNNIAHPDNLNPLFNHLSNPMPVFLPSIVVNGQSKIKKIAAGLDHIVILLENGQVNAIGFNQTGQLGDTTIVPRPIFIHGNTTFSNASTSWANFSTATHGSVRSALAPTVKSAAEVMAAGQWVADDISAFGQSTMVHVPGFGWYGWGDNSHGQLGNPVPTTSIGYLLSASFAQGTQDKQ